MTIRYLRLPPDLLSPDGKKGAGDDVSLFASTGSFAPWLTKGAGNHKVIPRVT